MTTPLEIVTKFCNALVEDGGRPAIRRWFTPETVWTNVGISSTTGIDEAIRMIDELERSMGIATVRIDMLSIAADGNRVLTERLDIFERTGGREIGRGTLMASTKSNAITSSHRETTSMSTPLPLWLQAEEGSSRAKLRQISISCVWKVRFP